MSEAPRPQRSMSTGRKRLFAAITLTLVGALIIGMLEAGSYVYLKMAYGYDGEHLMNYRFDPYKNIQPTPGFEDTRGIRHNAQGFRRSSDTPRQKPEGTIRVFLMGGSTGYGLGSLSRYGMKDFEIIGNDETIDYYLEEILQKRFPGQKVEVINAAITSFYSHHHLVYLNQTVLKYDPDLILFLDGFNDYFHTNRGFDQWRDYAYSERAHVFLGKPTVGALAYYTGWWFFRKSHFANLAGRALKNLPFILSPSDEDRGKIDMDLAMSNVVENAHDNFALMVERNSLILKHEGVDAIFALQPEIAFEQSKTWAPLEEDIYAEMVSYWPEGFIEFKNQAKPVVYEILEQAASVGDASTMDLSDIYGDLEAPAYTDYCHLTPDGNRVLAEAVAPRVEEMLRERIRRGQHLAGATR